MTTTQFTKCVNIIRTVLIVIFILITVPLLFPLCGVPLYLWRIVVKQLAKILRPNDLHKMLTTCSNLFAQDFPSMFSKGTREAIITTHVVEGKVTVEEFRQQFTEKVIQAKVKGDFIYPEFQQTITSFMGFLFWQWDKNFIIDNHVNIYTGQYKVKPTLDLQIDIPAIHNEWLTQPFQKGRSPWNFLIVNEDQPAHPNGVVRSIIFLKTAHALADGYSSLKVFLERVVGDKNVPRDVPQPKASQKPKTTVCQAGVNLIKFLTMAPIDAFSLIFNYIKYSSQDDKCQWSEGQLTGRLMAALSSPIQIDEIKEVKKIYGCSFHSVLQAGFTAGVRDLMLRNFGENKNGGDGRGGGAKQLPKYFPCVLPIYRKGHPSKLRNHMSAALISLAVDIEDPVDRLKVTETRVKKLMTSAVPTGFLIFTPCVGALPACLVRFMARHVLTNFCMTSVPGPLDTVNFFSKYPTLESVFGMGLQVGEMGIGLTSYSYKGQLRIWVGVDEGISRDPQVVKRLAKKIQEEIQILRALQIA